MAGWGSTTKKPKGAQASSTQRRISSRRAGGGSRRDAGFSIFYMGINLGAVLGSFFVPITAAAFGWSAGFALPALGMLFGLVQFQVTKNHLGTSGLVPLGKPATWWPIIGFMVVLVVVAALGVSGGLALNPVRISV